MRVSQRKGSAEIAKRPAGRSGPKRAAGGCISCGCPGGEPGLDAGGLCAECSRESSFARAAVAALIDRGLGVGRSELEAL